MISRIYISKNVLNPEPHCRRRPAKKQKTRNIHQRKFLTKFSILFLYKVKSCKDLLAHTEEDLAEAMRRDKKELKDKIESESGDVKRKMELETNEMRDRLQSEKKAASLAMEEEVEERKRDINQIRQTVSMLCADPRGIRGLMPPEGRGREGGDPWSTHGYLSCTRKPEAVHYKSYRLHKVGTFYPNPSSSFFLSSFL